MKRRLPPKDVPYARDGEHGRPAKEIAKRWMRTSGKRRSPPASPPAAPSAVSE